MQIKQLATYLNNAIMVNEIPEGSSWVRVAEDMSNYVEFGTQLANLTAQQLQNVQQNLVVQIRNVTINKVLEKKFFRMYKDSYEFQGAIQRIMAKELLAAQNSRAFNLDWNNGQSWFDGKYYGAKLDSRVYTDTDAFKVVHSIGDEDWKLAVKDYNEMARILGLIEENEKNTITAQVNALAKRLLIAMIDSCVNSTAPRMVHLVTEFNAKHNVGGTPYTIGDIQKDRDLNTLFNDFCKGVISKLCGYVTEMNTKYNNGEVTTFTSREDIDIVLIDDFAQDIKYITDPTDYNIPSAPSYETISAWQSTGQDIFPSFYDVSTIELTSGEIDNCVGVIYDTNTVGITTVADKIGIERVGAELFTNYHHHLANRYFMDERLGSIALFLD